MPLAALLAGGLGTWLGVIPTFAAEEDCRDPTHSTGHVYKALAMLALLEYKEIDWVVFIDMDTLCPVPLTFVDITSAARLHPALRFGEYHWRE